MPICNFKIGIGILIGTLLINPVGIFAQQTPSQRYQPVSNQTSPSTPPSVHVPPAQSRQLSAGPSASHVVTSDQANNVGAEYSFSDNSLGATTSTKPQFRAPVPRNVPGNVRQTTYETNVDREPAVPDILKKTPAKPIVNQSTFVRPATKTQTPTSTLQLPTVPTQSAKPKSPKKPANNTPERFAAQMQQIRSASPRLAPEAFVAPNPIRQSKPVPPGKTAAATPTSFTTPKSESDQPFEGSASKTVRNATRPAPARESASEFISKLATKNQSQTEFQSSPSDQPAKAAPATMVVPKNHHRDAQVQQASRQVPESKQASITLAAPAIKVETHGPQSIGINKPAAYKVVVNNISNSRAEGVMVALNLPGWVDIENINMTTGEKEIGNGDQNPRLLWKIDNIPGNGSQSMTITAVPRKSEMFDLALEWTLSPRTGAANIEVTQPRLEMQIAGPDEVQYGEQALYHVTVRNPGTGTAENVTVMLPEALGGERATLGDIPPGSDKNFQVELLARTAGQLDLMATAVAEGNLQTTADRKLVVRRAILGIDVQGPALKYAGSDGQFVVTVTNTGDAAANEIIAALALPNGVEYQGGIESVKRIEGGLRWQVGALQPGEQRQYNVNCLLNTSGDLQVEVGAQAKNELQAASACVTKVETVADLVLTVRDPKGPLPTGQATVYEINVRNRGTRAAKAIDMVMQFSEGIEPKQATGLEHRIVPGQVLFAPISQLEPGQEMTFQVRAEAFQPGTHIFRAQLVCKEADSREIAEGTTRFFGDEIQSAPAATANNSNQAGGNDFQR